MILFGLALGLIISWALMVCGWDMHERNEWGWADAISFVGLCGLVVCGSLFWAELAL